MKHALPPFVIIPSEIFKKKLTLRQVMVLAALYSWRKANTNTVKISRQMISERTGYSIKRISEITTALTKLGFIKKSGKGGNVQWCTYTLQNLNILKTATTTPKKGATTTPKKGATTTPKKGATTTPKKGARSTTERDTERDTEKKTKKKISYAEKVKNFEPTSTTANTFKKKYPHFANNKEEYLKLLEQFKDQALNRKNPFIDLNAGMRTYIEHEYIKPVRQVVRKNEIGSFKDIGDIVRAEKKNNAMTGLPKQILIDEK